MLQLNIGLGAAHMHAVGGPFQSTVKIFVFNSLATCLTIRPYTTPEPVQSSTIRSEYIIEPAILISKVAMHPEDRLFSRTIEQWQQLRLFHVLPRPYSGRL